MLRIALFRSIQTSSAELAWIEMSKKTKIVLTIYRISSRWKHAKPKKYRRPKQKEQKIGKTNNKRRSQNYRFASDQNANAALKSATSFNEPIKKLCKLAIEIGHEFWTKNIILEAKLCLKKWKTLQGTKAKQKLTANSWKENSKSFS